MNLMDGLAIVLKLRRIVAVISVLAGGATYKFGPAAWHKFNPHHATSVAASAGTNGVAATLFSHDLGEVTLTNHYETSVSLGHGKNCLVVPRVIDSRNVQLTLSLESRTTDGLVHDLTVTQVTAKPGKPMEVAVGDFSFSMTPKLISE